MIGCAYITLASGGVRGNVLAMRLVQESVLGGMEGTPI